MSNKMTSARIASAFQRASNRGSVAMLLGAGRALLAQFYRLIGRRYVTRSIHGYRMILDLYDPGLSRGLMLFRTREVDHKVMLERIVKPGMRIFDIGGNIGYYPLMELSLLGGTGQMIVIEPLPQNVALLERNLRLNNYSDVVVIEAAMSNVSTEKTFHLSKHSNLGTFHPEGSVTELLSGSTLDVKTLTVPMLAQRFGPPDLLRMDIEGHEVEVFESMLDDISNGAYAPTIIFETHCDRYSQEHDMAAALRRLFQLGYCVPIVSSSSDMTADQLIRLGYKPGQRLATDAIHRTLFADIRPDDAIDIICRNGTVRTVVLAHRRHWNTL
jgi:FkbM family methyltransferase